MSRGVTSQSRDVLPRVLDEAAMTGDVDDGGDQYLLFSVPSSRYYPGSAAAAHWSSRGAAEPSSSGKTRVWKCIGNGRGADDDHRRRTLIMSLYSLTSSLSHRSTSPRQILPKGKGEAPSPHLTPQVKNKLSISLDAFSKALKLF